MLSELNALRSQLESSQAEFERLKKDKERLDWMIANEARLSHSRDGDCCNVWIRSDEDGEDYVPAEGFPQKVYNDGREAIDAAMQPASAPVREAVAAPQPQIDSESPSA